MKTIVFPATPIDTTGLATEAKQDTQITEAQSTNTKLDTIISQTASINRLEIKETTALLDTSSTNIPASSGNPLELVASTTAIIRKIQSVEDIGEFMGIYEGAALSETLVGILPLGGGEIEVNLPAATRISIRNMKNSAITTGFITLNLLG